MLYFAAVVTGVVMRGGKCHFDLRYVDGDEESGVLVAMLAPAGAVGFQVGEHVEVRRLRVRVKGIS
jgi:hypothetical protein